MHDMQTSAVDDLDVCESVMRLCYAKMADWIDVVCDRWASSYPHGEGRRFSVDLAKLLW